MALTPLTTYFTNTNSTTLPTSAFQLSATHGVDNTNVTQDYSLVGTATGWGQICARGTANPWAGGASIGNPDGNGFTLESAIVNLASNQFPAGNWSSAMRLCMGHTDGTIVGTVSGDFHIRVFKLSAGIYTQIIDMPLTAQTVSVLATLTLPGTTGIFTNFAVAEIPYVDIWANVIVNANADAALNFRLNRISTNNTGDANAQIVTPGYQPIPTPPPAVATYLYKTRHPFGWTTGGVQ